MAGAIFEFFRKWTAVAGPNAHASDAYEMTGYLTLLTDVNVAGQTAGPFTVQPMESMDGQQWNPRGAPIPCAPGHNPVGPFTNCMRYVRLDATAAPGTVTTFYAIGVARDA